MANGLEQVAAMTKLSTEKAWEPSELGGFEIGEVVRLNGIQTEFQIIRFDDPLAILLAPSGRELKAGWRSLQRVRRKGRKGKA